MIRLLRARSKVVPEQLDLAIDTVQAARELFVSADIQQPRERAMENWKGCPTLYSRA
jgi:hypothetical protein